MRGLGKCAPADNGMKHIDECAYHARLGIFETGVFVVEDYLQTGSEPHCKDGGLGVIGVWLRDAVNSTHSPGWPVC